LKEELVPERKTQSFHDTDRRWLTQWVALVAVLSLVVGCGIAGQSPSPRSSLAASQPASSNAATATPSAVGTPPASSTAGASGSPTATATPEVTEGPPATPRPTPAGQLTFGNWIGYMDLESGRSPTLDRFTAETGIQVSYQEDINDNSEMFGIIQPDLAAGHSTGYDLLVFSDWMIARLIRLGYIQELDYSQLPNFEPNAQDLFRNPWYDPSNRYSIPWQAGIVGIGYNPKLTGRPITSFNDLLDPAFAGNVGMFSEMIDTMSLALLSLGVDPPNATIDDVTAVHDKLLAAAQSGQFQDFYGNDYYDALAGGNIALTMAWGGDITQMKLYDNPDVEFVIPQEGGLLFVDNMVIPNFAEHPADAYSMMNFWYDPANATTLSEFIGYFSPVRGVQERILADAQAARDSDHPILAERLQATGETVFPNAEQLANVHQYKILSEDEERQWNDLFNEIVNG
jgi:spermidine/putrescine transport system substrate-binding protein